MKVKICYDCGKEFSNRGKTAQRCLECAKARRIAYKAAYNRFYQLKKRELGTTDFSEHRLIDFEAEHKAIRAEMRQLGVLKRQKKRQ